ncbi:MAG: N-6 DNA methylase, partial [Ignavibacteriae bacterium]|nr:N-6 DNA methylase [Ignavibacteriota bacterium]
MNNPKLTGSFYTPTLIADFLVDHIAKRINVDYLEILEPSAGDGVFIQSIYDHELLSTKIKNVVAVEREEKELDKVKGITKSPSLGTLHLDFLEYQKDNARKFDLVIGNPPYIKKKLLSAEQIALCEDIHIIYPDLSKKKINNIWSAFLVRCINFLKEDGILAFVLPSELLQVKFAAELRALILKEFEHVEIFTFNELLFKDCKGQDTILLVGERKSEKKGIYYSNIKNIDNLEKKEFKLKRNIKIKESKWTHHHLNSGEIRLLEMLKNKLQTVNYYCISKPGIVTAANNFFIVNSATLKKYSLQRFVKPIIQKGSFV